MEAKTDTTAAGANHDLTEFFLEWRDTCAIDLCKRKDDVNFVHAVFDSKFRELTANARSSKMKNLVSVSEFTPDFKRTHAFHLVEIEFYTPGERSGTSKRYGQALKNYLFESSEAKRNPGGLNGYLLLMLKDVVKKSFKRSAVSRSDPIGDNRENGEGQLLLVGNPDTNKEGVDYHDPAQVAAVQECFAEFCSRFATIWKELDKVERLALLCDIFNIPRSNEEILAASGLGKTAFYNRSPLVRIRGIADTMLPNYNLSELVHVVRNCIGKIAYDLGRDDPGCVSAIDFIKDNRLA